MKLFNAQSKEVAANLPKCFGHNLDQKVLGAQFFDSVSGGMLPLVPPLNPKPKNPETKQS